MPAPAVRVIADSPEFKLQIAVFFLATALNHHMRRNIALFLFLHQFKKRFKAKGERQVIRIVCCLGFFLQPCLVDDTADQDEVM
ncbi:hypothetical protein N8D55_22425 [Xanthomonas hortorum pv. pelargonii]|nr:hypothetical protein N8D55_22425 [Xanthomonas hortorum pv. pelargonii]